MIEGWFFDGRTSKPLKVMLDDTERASARLSGEMEYSYPMSTVSVDPRVGTAPRRLRFADGASFETDDCRSLDRWLAATRHKQPWWERIERHTSAALIGLALTALCAWAVVTHGIPRLAEYVAAHAPPHWDEALGQQTWQTMGDALFEPSALSSEKQHIVSDQFERIRKITPDATGYRLFIRKSGTVGANAITLPGGWIVVTDDLVNLSSDPDELAAVLAHEFGHAHYRHGLRTTMEHSVLGLIVAAVSGDISVIGGSLPILLVQSGYSRQFESQADRYAAERLQALGIPISRLADMLERLERFDCGKQPINCAQPGWLSSHPATAERASWLRELGRKPTRSNISK